jgi:hypothetical protein
MIKGFLAFLKMVAASAMLFAVRTGPWNLMDCFFKKDFRIIKGFCLDILR